MKNKIFLFLIGLMLSTFSIFSEIDHNTLSYFWAARNFEEKGEIERAKEIYLKIKDKGIVDVYYYLAQIFIKEENYDLAIENLSYLKKIENYKELAFTSLVANLDIESEIKKIKDEKKKKEEEEKKSKEELEKKISILTPIPCRVFLEENQKVKIMKGELDNLGLEANKKLILIKNDKIVGEVEIIEVRKLFSLAKIISIFEKPKEGSIIADKIKIKEEK
jgi:tetratricopeptide (TPR) repeat protein